MKHHCLVQTALLLIHLAGIEGTVSVCAEIEGASNYSQIRFSSQELASKELEDVLYESRSLHIQVSGIAILSSVLEFSGKRSLSIAGNGMAEIYCTGNNSGISFRNTTNIEIRGVAFCGCGSIQNSTSTDYTDPQRTLDVKCALYFIYCSNISMAAVTLERSDGVGVVIYNSDGVVSFVGCNFTENAVRPGTLPPRYAGGGGIRFAITSCLVGEVCGSWCNHTRDFNEGTVVTIEGCIFRGNKATTLHEELSNVVKGGTLTKQRLGRGGGLFVILARFSIRVSIDIIDSRFSGNSAVWGGGMGLFFTNSARENSVSVTDCIFSDNEAKRGDGGMVIGIYYNEEEVRNNSVVIRKTSFLNNIAPRGGGVAISSSDKTKGSLGNAIVFDNCTWMGNRAIYGIALELQAHRAFIQDGGSAILRSCQFLRNFGDTGIEDHPTSFQAVVSVTSEYLAFEGTSLFDSNVGTALLAFSSTITLDTYGQLQFANNSATRGGAMALVTLSKLVLHEHSTIYFANNYAYYYGGAIYVKNIDALDPYLFSDAKCPIQCKNSNGRLGCNASFTFDNNTAGQYKGVHFGNSIYFSSVESCIFECTRNESSTNSVQNLFKCIGPSKFGKESDFVTTDKQFVVEESEFLIGSVLSVTPGKECALPVRTADSFGNSVYSIFYAILETEDSEMEIDEAYATVSSAVPRLLVYGNPTNRGTLELRSFGNFQYQQNLSMVLLPCPPGYSMVDEPIEMASKTKKNVRICSCYNQTRNFYLGVFCRNDFDSFQALLRYGYWAGYVENRSLSDSITSENFYTGVCPLGFCQHPCSNSSASQECGLSAMRLPAAGNPAEVDHLVCGSRRTGILCGRCRDGHSVFFHSLQYECNLDRFCQWGWFFYMISELLPVTLLFLAVIIFNVSLTSGAVYGFVFFAQTIDSLLVNSNYSNRVFLKRVEENLPFRLHQVIYRFFNLEFFSVERLSFCLWKGATTLDVSVFKYVTVVYAFLLVAATVLILNKCKIGRVLSRRMSSTGNYMIHGLTAFLILCYAQCVLVSFQLLFSIRLQGINYRASENMHVFYSGDVILFSAQHLPYVVPALVCFSTFVLLPPLVLLWHPVIKQVLAKCGLAESRFVVLVDRLLLINRLKPVIDSLQSPFKDNCRYFAGLYFIYRVILLLGLLVVKNSQLYVLVSVFILLMMLFHSVIQPFRSRWNNIINGFFLSNMLSINVISLSVNHSLLRDNDQMAKSFVRVLTGIQELLIYIPLGYIILYVFVSLVRRRAVFEKIRVRMWRGRSRKKHADRIDYDLNLSLTEYSAMRSQEEEF